MDSALAADPAQHSELPKLASGRRLSPLYIAEQSRSAGVPTTAPAR